MQRVQALRQNPVLRYFSALASGSMLALLISFLIQAYLSRVVSVEVFGQLSYAKIVSGYLILALGFGFETYFLRALIDRRLSPEGAVSIQVWTRLPPALLAVAGLLAWGAWGGWTPGHQIIVLYSLVTVSYVFNLDWMLQARERFSALATINVVRGLFTLALALLFIHGAGDAVRYVLIIGVAEVLRTAYEWWLLRPLVGGPVWPQIGETLKKSVAISASFFMISLYYNVDSVMLAHYRGDRTVGIYTAAYNILNLAIMPTSLLYQAFSPTLVRNPWHWPTFKRYASATMGLAVVVFVGLLTLHRFAILLVYGQKYAESAPVLLLLSFNVLSSYLAGAFSNPVNIWGHHTVFLRIVAAGALTNVVINFLLIPRYGIPAAVVTTILSELVVASGAAIFVLRKFRRDRLAGGPAEAG